MPARHSAGVAQISFTINNMVNRLYRKALLNNMVYIKLIRRMDLVKNTNGNQLAAINLDNGEFKVLTSYEDLNTNFDYHQYIPYEDSHLFTLSYVNKNNDMRECKLLKIKEATHEISILNHSNTLYWDSLIFDPINDVYILQDEFKLSIIDSTFTKILREQTLFRGKKEREATGYFTHFHQSPDSKLIVATYDKMVLILRFEDLEILIMENIPYASFAEFSDDNQYLLVGTWSNGYVLENNLK